MSRVEREKKISQKSQPKIKGAEKSASSLFSKFRQRATFLGLLTLAGIFSCGEVSPPTSPPASQTENEVKKTPALNPTLKVNTLANVKTIESTPPESERQKETYNVVDFLLNEMLIGYQFQPQKEQERIRNSLLIHSRGEPIIYPIGTSVPFVDGLKRQIEQENIKQQTKLTQQQKTDRLIETILGMEENGVDHFYNGGSPTHEDFKSELRFIIMKQPYDIDRRDIIKIKEAFCFSLFWFKGSDILAGNEDVLKLYNTDTRNAYVDGTGYCAWYLYNPNDYAPNADDRRLSFILSPDSELMYNDKGQPYGWDAGIGYSMKPGSNSPHLAWDNKNQDVVLTNNENILGKISVKNLSWPRPHYIIMELLDNPIPINK